MCQKWFNPPTAHGAEGGDRSPGFNRNTAQVLLAVFLTVMGVALLFSSFWVPPVGELSPSVLVAFGQVLTFTGALLGMDYHYRAKR